MGVIKVMGQNWGWNEMVMHCLLEILKGRVRQNSHWKVVLSTGEVRNKRVEVYNRPGFWKFNQGVVVE